ncbi:MAG: phosphatidate cytidylyltransferase [Chitinophagaceae bacterium]
MKKNLFAWSLVLACLASLSSCAAIGGIFKAGVWTGFIIVAIIIAIIIFIISRSSKK